MKQTPEQNSSSTTTEADTKLQVKENSHLFSEVDKLAADHYVRVSNTMIKVTYKKALKDQNASDNAVSGSMKCSELAKKKSQHVKVADLCNSDISFIANSARTQLSTEAAKAFAYHSTPKTPGSTADKKKKYVNGLNLLAKSSYTVEENSPAKAQKGFSPRGDAASSLKKSKVIPVKGTNKAEVSKRIVKVDNSLVKPKGSIIQRNRAEVKKITLNKSCSKIKKLENSLKKKVEVDKKGLKRKASNTKINVLAKKIKMSEGRTKGIEGGGKFEENCKSGGGKKPIMLVDPDLPAGWTRYIRTKNKGSANEQYVVYVVNPQGKKFRFKWKLRKYLEKTNSSLDVDRFFFGLYQRPKSSNPNAAVDRGEELKNGGAPANRGDASDRSHDEKGSARDLKRDEISQNFANRSSDGKELLLFDPDLPFGWRRVIHSNVSSGKKQVHIISPDGKIFRRRYRLNEYLTKHQFTHNLDRFYFGLYPKKEGNVSDNSGRESEDQSPSSVKTCRQDDLTKMDESAMVESENENESNDFRDVSKSQFSSSPMHSDPNLPEGWKRYIKIRSCGGNPGRMEVVIVSPDGRRHRSRKHLEHYLMHKESEHKAKDFDFRLFGQSSLKKNSDLLSKFKPESESEQQPGPDRTPNEISFFGTKKKFTDKPVPELDIDSLKEINISPEGHMINTVNGLMMSCGLSSARNVRRQRLPRNVHEKQVKSHVSSEGDTSCNGCEIPVYWIQRLVKCRGDFRTLEPDAVSTVGKAAKEFIKKISFLALSVSKEPDRGLRYEDVAELVHRSEGLSPLQTLIPKKITYKEYIKLNRPKQFLSFT